VYKDGFDEHNQEVQCSWGANKFPSFQQIGGLFLASFPSELRTDIFDKQVTYAHEVMLLYGALYFH